MKYLLIISFFIHLNIFAEETSSINEADTPFVTTEVYEEKDFNPRSNHWISSFGFETIKYEIPGDFEGVKKTIGPRNQELWGGRLGVGREYYFGAGFNTTTKAEAYYVGTLFTSRNVVEKESSTDETYTKFNGNLWGIDLGQSIGFLFDFKTKNPFLDEWAYLTVEPFIEAGIGQAWAYGREIYNYNFSGVDERYEIRISDNLTNTRFGGGINLTSSSGYFLYVKGMINNFDVTERKIRTQINPNAGVPTSTSETDKKVKIDPVTVYMLGGGVKF